MVEVSDQMLMAYADNELDAASRAEIDALLPARPDLAVRIAQFMRTRHDVQQAFNSILNEHVPAALLDSVRSLPLGNSNVEPFRKPSASRSSAMRGATSSSFRTYTAMAASIGLLIGCASGWYARAVANSPVGIESVAAPDAGIRATGAIQTALETGVSQVPVAIASVEGGTVVPLTTFRGKDKRYCREYEISSDSRYQGLACRNAKGGWDVVFHGRTAVKTVASAPGSLGPAAAKPQLPIDVAVDEIIDGGVFDRQEELDTIKNGWK